MPEQQRDGDAPDGSGSQERPSDAGRRTVSQVSLHGFANGYVAWCRTDCMWERDTAGSVLSVAR